jgi:hypothetical protein
MATPKYPNVGTLEQAAQYRTGVPTRLLNVLTGGLAGQISGSTERAQEAASARRALLEEDLMLKRMKAQRQFMIEEDLKRLAAQREADLVTGTAKARGTAMALSGDAGKFVGPLDAATMAGVAEGELAQARTKAEQMNARKSRETAMRGYLAGRNVQLGDPDLETVEFLEAQEKTKEAAEKEARLTKAGYMSFYIPGLGQISGTPDNIEETKKKYPQYKTIIENAVKQAESGEALFTPTVEEDPVTGYRKRKLVFKPGTPISVMKAAEEEYFGKQKGAFDGEPAAGTPATKATKPTNIPGFTVKRVQ